MNGKKLIAITLAVVVITIISVVIFLNYYNSEIRKFQRNWDVTLPKNTEVVYNNADIGWFGEGVIYVVFKFEDEPSDLLTIFSSTIGDFKEGNSDFENRVDSAIDPLDVPSNRKVSWESDYYWKIKEKDSSTLYLIYLPETYELIAIEIIN